MELGPFSVLLAVKDLKASRSFYEKLGFTASSPDPSNKNWVMMKNGEVEIGLFQGIFERNNFCFNPGGKLGKPVKHSTDIRELHRELKAKGVKFTEEHQLTSKSGPAAFMLTDPDGNQIWVEQHI